VRVYKSKKDSILYVSLSHGNSLYFQTLAIAAAKKRFKRILVHHHTFFPISNPKQIQNRICHTAMKNSVEHIFLSESMRQKYLEVWRPTSKTWVVTNHAIAGLRTKIEKAHGNKNGKHLSFTGRMSAEKGFWECVAVIRALFKADPEMKATIMGPATETAIKEEIKNLSRDFPNNFRFYDKYSPNLLSEVLDITTFYLFPSKYLNEASPLVVLEAQSLGNICMTSTVGSLPDDVIPPGTCVEINQWPDKVIQRIIDLKENGGEMVKASREIRHQSETRARNSVRQLEEVFKI